MTSLIPVAGKINDPDNAVGARRFVPGAFEGLVQVQKGSDSAVDVLRALGGVGLWGVVRSAVRCRRVIHDDAGVLGRRRRLVACGLARVFCLIQPVKAS